MTYDPDDARWVSDGVLLDVTKHFPDGHTESQYVIARRDQNGFEQTRFVLDEVWYFLPLSKFTIYRVSTKQYIGITARRMPGMGECYFPEEKRGLQRQSVRETQPLKAGEQTTFQKAIISLYDYDASWPCGGSDDEPRDNHLNRAKGKSDLARHCDDNAVVGTLKV